MHFDLLEYFEVLFHKLLARYVFFFENVKNYTGGKF